MVKPPSFHLGDLVFAKVCIVSAAPCMLALCLTKLFHILPLDHFSTPTLFHKRSCCIRHSVRLSVILILGTRGDLICL